MKKYNYLSMRQFMKDHLLDMGTSYSNVIVVAHILHQKGEISLYHSRKAGKPMPADSKQMNRLYLEPTEKNIAKMRESLEARINSNIKNRCKNITNAKFPLFNRTKDYSIGDEFCLKRYGDVRVIRKYKDPETELPTLKVKVIETGIVTKVAYNMAE
jgi:hypothetical protein